MPGALTPALPYHIQGVGTPRLDIVPDEGPGSNKSLGDKAAAEEDERHGINVNLVIVELNIVFVVENLGELWIRAEEH